MRLLLRAGQAAAAHRERGRRGFWGWINAVFNK